MKANTLPDSSLPAAISDEAHKKWLIGGYVFIALFFMSRLIYLAVGRIELSEDEAYQWLWSKHLALSYFSKPPLIAYAQFIGTSLWGDTEFGIRFLSPVFGLIASVAMLRFMAAEVNARVGFWLVVILAATPLIAVGSTLLTVDSPSVMFWVLAMITGWRAAKFDSFFQWCLTGLFIGLGLLSKYTAIVQIISWVIFFTAYPAARAQLRRAGPYVALVISCLAFVPVIVWNAQHDWITLTHLKDRGGLSEPWKFRPGFVIEFLGSEFGLLNPVFFVGMICVCVTFWPLARRQPLLLYFFCMGAPLFLFYFFYTIRSRVLPNWIAPCVVPLFALMVAAESYRWHLNGKREKPFLIAGLVLGFLMMGLLQVTELPKIIKFARVDKLVEVITGKPIMVAKLDPLHRVRNWSTIASMIEAERQKVLLEGKPVFLIAQHYGLTGILSFYIPEAKKRVQGEPLVYYLRTARPNNQFYFWPSYNMRKGESAIFVHETDSPFPTLPQLTNDFRSVTDLGMRDAYYAGQVFRRYQLYLCRDLR